MSNRLIVIGSHSCYIARHAPTAPEDTTIFTVHKLHTHEVLACEKSEADAIRMAGRRDIRNLVAANRFHQPERWDGLA